MSTGFLDRVYQSRTPEEFRQLYEEWSSTYDREVLGHGYATPARCAAALAQIAAEFDSPVLDYGCGTGLSGEQLAQAGFQTIDGCDISEAMLDVARDRRLYRKLTIIDPDDPQPFGQGEYRHITAVGVISSGAAPISTFERLVGLLDSGGTLTFSFNDHTMQLSEYVGRVAEYVDTSAVELLFKERGEHLPGIDLQSTVFVVQKR